MIEEAVTRIGLQRQYIIIIIIIIIGIQPLGQYGQREDWYCSGTLHPGQVLRGSLPLLSPAF